MTSPLDPIFQEDPNRAVTVTARFLKVDADMYERAAMDVDGSTTRDELVELAAMLSRTLDQPIFYKAGQGAAFIGELVSGASHQTDQGHKQTDLGLRVCGFGRLVVVARSNPANPTDGQLEYVYALLRELGFFAVSTTEAMVPYTGLSQRLKDSDATWYTRLFGYG